MTRKLEPVSAGIWAPKRWGKSALLEQIARWFAQQASVNRVVIIDPTRALFSRPALEAFWSFEAYRERIDARGSFPRLAVHGYGEDLVAYEALVSHLVASSRPADDTCLVVDEAHILCPASGPHVESLIPLATLQRHFSNAHGEVCSMHVIIASQRPTAVRAALRENLDAQVYGRFTGRATLRLVEDQYGAFHVRRLELLEPHEWATLEGKTPPHIPFESLP